MCPHSAIVLSVIIPVYNSEGWLARCLDSILAQVVPVPWEIVLIDDGSTDNSGGICDDYARSFPLVRVVHTNNQGASIARRTGLEIALGEYVSFVDSDDFVSPNYLSTLYDLEKQFGTGVCACKVQKTLPGEILETDSTHRPPSILEEDALFLRFFKYEFWGLCGKLYRKEYLMDIPFPKATICEDYSVMVKLLFRVEKMAYSDNSLYYYEEHPGSLSRQQMSLRSFEEFDNVNDVFNFTSANLPKYRAYAMSNVAETAVKLLLASRKAKTSFSAQRKRLISFLAEHRSELLFCKPLNPKTRLLALGCSF